MENIKISPNNNPDNSSNINGFNYDGEKLLRVYRNENESLKTIINHYEATLKCRENLISKYVYDLQENKKIIQKQKKIIISLSSELNTLKNQRLLKEKAPTPKHVSTGLITAKNSQKSKLEHLYMRS